MLEVKFESDTNGVTEETVGHGNNDTASVRGHLDMQPGKPTEGKRK